MTVSTLDLAPALAFDAVSAFDGDDMYGMQVKSLTAILDVAPMSSRKMVAWIHETTGTLISQSTITRALSVATALRAVHYSLAGEDSGIVHSTVANLVRIKIAKPEHGGGSKGLDYAIGFWGGDYVGFCSDVAAYWETVTDSRDNVSHDDSPAEGEATAEADTDDTGAGAPVDETVGGGESAIDASAKAATIMREYAGHLTTGRMAPTDELIAAAQAILANAAAALATLDAATAEDNTGALAIA